MKPIILRSFDNHSGKMIWRVNEMPQFKWGFSISSEVRKLWYNANIWCNKQNAK